MRLVDADELMEHAWRDKLDSRELIAKMIDNAPTVKEIPTKIPIDIFEKLVSQEPKWIPVSERLPEVGSEVLVCFDFKGKKSVYISTFYSDGEFHGLDDEYLTPEGRKYRKAVAWMPLPEPYRAESEDKE